MAFYGSHVVRLDEKGRLFLPAKWRDELAGGIVITRGHDHVLNVYAAAVFEELTERLRTAPTADRRTRRDQRMVFGGVTDEIPDKQGRVTIPAPLREYARLTRECAVVGAATRIEIWDADAWRDYLATEEEEFAGVSEEVGSGLL